MEQLNLEGKPVKQEKGEEPSISLWKSALQKAVRRGQVERAMYSALMLLEKGGSWITWKRLSVIADEDVENPMVITAVDVLYRKFQAMRKNRKEGESYSWDEKRCVVLAAKILAEAKKDRMADEFLELVDAMSKGNVKMPKDWMPSDEAYDMHTEEGRRMGRGLEFWYKVSSKCVNMTDAYAKWRSWWEHAMLELRKKVKSKTVKNNSKKQKG